MFALREPKLSSLPSSVAAVPDQAPSPARRNVSATGGEVSVLGLDPIAAGGAPVDEIADRRRTVRNHVSSAMNELNAASRGAWAGSNR